ncbi:hypothetical protein GS491_26155 [Rhodococcus hoagii]|jgi:hypothetical protein|uniref:hypothetical protein n=1 Tax=Rhodococcus hoagii TaxID=43767 RepID=UPI0019E6CAB7|nr:hypothetical protein [Prescottella equi]NKR80609.1 hypothetical protein [Prescottella equi]NKS99459.1 hypothetical protein [Prescottella equi]
MVTRTHLTAVARRLKKELNGKAFMTIERSTLTTYLREESGEPTTRLRTGKTGVAADLTDALIAQGVLVYPALVEAGKCDAVRLYRSGTVVGRLIDTIVYPDPGSDAELGDVLTKIKGKWNWTPNEDPELPDPDTLAEPA